MKGLQDFDGLRGKGDDVGCSHFHAFGGDAPFGGGKVDFGPAGANEFAGAHEGQGHEFHGEAGVGVALVGFDFPQQFGHFFGVEAGVVFFGAGLERVGGAHVGARVALDDAVGHCVVHDLGAGLQGAFGDVYGAAIFDALGHGEERCVSR